MRPGLGEKDWGGHLGLREEGWEGCLNLMEEGWIWTPGSGGSVLTTEEGASLWLSKLMEKAPM